MRRSRSRDYGPRGQGGRLTDLALRWPIVETWPPLRGGQCRGAGSAAAISAAISAGLLSLLGTGCGGQQAAPSASRPASQVPSSASPVTGGSATRPGLVFRASATVLTPAMRAQMTGVSWRQGCPVGLDPLKLLRLSYWGFDHTVHRGELVANESVAAGLARTHAVRGRRHQPVREPGDPGRPSRPARGSFLGEQVTVEPGTDCTRRPGLECVQRHRLDMGRGLEFSSGLHALFRQWSVSACFAPPQFGPIRLRS
jgi:hypothetical protein